MSQAELDVDALLASVNALRKGGHDPADMFAQAGVNNVNDTELLLVLQSALADSPAIIQMWQLWSYDKRWSPSPYLDQLEVGHYDAGRRHVRQHENLVDACADFILAEIRWVVERRVITPANDTEV